MCSVLQDEAYHETCPRIFPGPGGMDTVLNTMLTKSEQRINAAQRPGNDPATAAAHAILHATATTAAANLVEQAALASGSQEERAHIHRHEVKVDIYQITYLLY